MQVQQHLHKSFTRTSWQEPNYHKGQCFGAPSIPAARFSWPPFPAVRCKEAVSWEPTGGSHGESTWRKQSQLSPCWLNAPCATELRSKWRPVRFQHLESMPGERNEQKGWQRSPTPSPSILPEDATLNPVFLIHGSLRDPCSEQAGGTCNSGRMSGLRSGEQRSKVNNRTVGPGEKAVSLGANVGLLALPEQSTTHWEA